MDEKKVLKKLGITDFRHLTKEKVIKMASILDKMDPEVAKKALEQFPEFANTARELLGEYREFFEKGIEANNQSVKECYNVYHPIIESLQKELEKEKLTFEERKYIIEQMKDIADTVYKKDTENKKFILNMVTIAGMVVGGTIVTLASVLGGSTQVTTDNDIDDSEI